ncbi:uncharacterized protein LOC135115538 [Scylla paramamosain]|uniref:uncharacterized protein LOC135115538 n=1 Tax=Scylla paramamosain TaxID=85552 RepID=UPI0030831D42
MHTSWLLEVVAVAVVVVASPATTEPSTYGNSPSLRRPFLGPYGGHPAYHSPFSSPINPGVLWPHFAYSHGIHDTYPDFEDQFEPSQEPNPVDDLSHQILEAHRRYREDFQLLRRLLREQHNLLKNSQQDTAQIHPPIFRLPLYPDLGTEEEEEHATSDELPFLEEVDYEKDYEHGSEDDESNIFQDSPVPGPEWAIIPFLPEVPDADDLPDNYNNATHAIHVVNGSRVEVNTTTNKETGDSITTFFHTEVINILPEEDTKAEEPEETVTEEPVLDTTPEEREVATTQPPEEPPAEEETKNEMPIPSAELVALEEIRPQRDAANHDPASKPVALRSASYSKLPSDDPGKGKEDKDAKPKDLSGDTLVNQLSKDTKDGSDKEPDAEVLL